eukprot:6941812-Lingulodinium_polyedra.AAC.1
MLNARGALTASYFSELDPALAEAVQNRWQQMARLGKAIPHHWLARDVWDLLRGGAELLRRMLGDTPRGALVLIIGGSPCQQLARAG